MKKLMFLSADFTWRPFNFHSVCDEVASEEVTLHTLKI